MRAAKPRPTFSSSITTILTMVGVAVGLGNVWRFPYMMGSYGGSAFLFVYLAFVFLIGIPAVMGEWALGRETRRGPLGALSAALGRKGRRFGWCLLVTVFVANSYYLVIIGNVVYTLAFSVATGFREQTLEEYHSGLDNGWLQAGITIALIATAMLVLSLGLNRGIERTSRWFVPFFGVAFLYLIVTALALDGATDALREFLVPDFSLMTPTNIFAAMGQAVFSLSLGGTFLVIYGSYLRPEESIPRSAIMASLGDVGAALLAALFLVPTTIVFGLELSSGPGLIFDTLPQLFAVIPGGRVAGTLFLTALAMMAFLSSIAAFQVLVGAARDSFGFSMGKTLAILGPAQALIMFPSALRPAIIGPLDLVFGSGMQVLGSGVALIGVGWGLGRAKLLGQVLGNAKAVGLLPRTLSVWIRWVVPSALALTLVLYLTEILR
jgi:NSS family neurotransmitter:Na+ symporter